MKKLLNRLSTLYPRRWRERYGVEFGHLLDDLQPRWTDLLDVLGGAAMMQFRAWSGYLKLMGAMAAVGVLLAVALSFAWPSRYQASAVIQAAGSSDHWLDAVSRTSLSEIIRRPNLDLYQGQRQREPLEDVIEGMRKDVHIERQGPSNLRITFLYGDAHKAQAVVDALAIKMTGRDYTGLPVVPIAPDRLRFSAWGFCAGLVLGIAAGLIRARRTRQALFVAAWGLAGCLIAASLSLLIPNRYTSSATLRHTCDGHPASRQEERSSQRRQPCGYHAPARA
jgi:hypothetical protein